MAEKSGENGAVYWNEGLDNSSTAGNIWFSTGKTIISSGSKVNFEALGYTAGMLVTTSGCVYAVGSTSVSTTANNRIFTIVTATTDTLTVSEAVQKSTGEAGAVRFVEAEPGVEVIGFYNWSLSYTGDTLEITSFDTTGDFREYIPGITGWTATAESHFFTTGVGLDDWVGEPVEIRLFTEYVASPYSTDKSQYWKGDTVVTGLDMTTPVDALITQSISFQGDRSLTLKTQTDPWSCGIST